MTFKIRRVYKWLSASGGSRRRRQAAAVTTSVTTGTANTTFRVERLNVGDWPDLGAS